MAGGRSRIFRSRRLRMPIMLLAGLSIWICGAPPVNKPAFAQSAAGSPQILEAESLFIVTSRGRFEIRAEIADNPDEQAKGLMFRDELAANEGMLFDFGARRMVTMWMKNTPLSLDMVFIRADGTVARVAERTVPNSLDTISSGEPVSFVLEIPGGVSKMLGIRPGDRLEHRLFTK